MRLDQKSGSVHTWRVWLVVRPEWACGQQRRRDRRRRHRNSHTGARTWQAIKSKLDILVPMRPILHKSGEANESYVNVGEVVPVNLVVDDQK